MGSQQNKLYSCNSKIGMFIIVYDYIILMCFVNIPSIVVQMQLHDNDRPIIEETSNVITCTLNSMVDGSTEKTRTCMQSYC